MALRDPVAVYNAASNLEAMMIREMLLSAGVEAYAVEDESRIGIWMFGLLPEIHKPQVWVDRSDVQRAVPLLQDFERRAAARRSASDAETTVDAACEECEAMSVFPASRAGSVETCPHCGAYMDVGDDPGLEGWDEPDFAEN